MGTSKRLVVSSTGFPGTNKTWRHIQEAWSEPLEAMAQLAGNKTILTGITQGFQTGVGTVYTNGYIAYEGKIYPFVGGVPTTNVTLIKEVESAEYDVDIDQDGQRDNLAAYETKYFRFGTGGEVTFPFSDLKRLKTVKELSDFQLPNGVVIDPNYFAFTQEMYNHLMTLQTNAQADWSVADSNSPAFIKNKPTSVARIVAAGSKWIGDVGSVSSGGTYTYIAFPSGLGMPNSNYMVHISLETVSTNNNHIQGTARLGYCIYNKTTAGFNIYFMEHGGVQDLNVRWAIIANH